MTTKDRFTYDVNQPEKNHHARTTLNPKEIAIMERLSTLAPNNKHLAMMFCCSIKTLKNQMTAIFRVLDCENRSSAILAWQKICSQYPPIESNLYWQISERIIANEQELERFRLSCNQWDSSDAPTGNYPPVIQAIRDNLSDNSIEN